MNTRDVQMRKRILVGCLTLSLAGSSSGAESPPPISITIAAQAVGEKFGDTTLEVHITNLSNRSLTVQTTDRVPPVGLIALDEKGDSAISQGSIIKDDGNTRNVPYTLGPKETKDYVEPIRKLLWRAETLPEKPPSGEVTIKALFGIIEYPEGVKVILVCSNTIKIKLVSRTK